MPVTVAAMSRRKQNCPKRRDFVQDETGEEIANSRDLPAQPSKSPSKESSEPCPAPLDLSTKKKRAPVKTYTDYSVANNLKPPKKVAKIDQSSLKESSSPNGPMVHFGGGAPSLLHPFPLHSSPFTLPAGPPLSGILPLRLPTCPATTAPSLPVPTPKTKGSTTCDSLNALSSLVQTVGTKSSGTERGSNGVPDAPSSSMKDNSAVPPSSGGGSGGLTMQDLWWKYMKKEESAEIKRVNEAKQIFTCLQCHQSFQSMDQLVKHMEVTQHFTNVPKHYSWSLQYARQKMRQMKLKLKYSERMMYFCHLCVAPFTVAVHQHFAEIHDMHNPVDNMNFVQIVMVNSNGTPRLASPSEHSTSSALDARTPTPTSLTDSSPNSSPAPPSTTHQKTPKHQSRNSLKDESSDNLLKKMEQLVKNAVDQTYDKEKKGEHSPGGEDILLLPPSKTLTKNPSTNKTK